MTGSSAPPSWAGQRERGSAVLLRPVLWLALHLGRGMGRLLLPPAVLWFLLACPGARAASRDYLGRALGRTARLRDVARHFHGFAQVVLDRAFLLSGRMRGFRIETAGLEHLSEAVAQGRGCILLGAHLGSFEALRWIARDSPVPVRVLMFRRNGGALTRLFDALAPAVQDAVIEIGRPEAMLQVRDCVAAGGIVGILADRAPGGQKSVPAGFLGSPARFPTGPFILAASLGAPVVLGWAVRTGRQRYTIQIEPFADRIVLPPGRRQEVLRDCAARFAARLGAACQADPFNWFNFYPFWEDEADAAPRTRMAAAPAGDPGRRGAAAVRRAASGLDGGGLGSGLGAGLGGGLGGLGEPGPGAALGTGRRRVAD